MSTAIERQNAVTTLQTAAGWLRETPALIGLFFVFALVNATGQLSGIAAIVGSLVGSLVSLLVAGIAHVSAADKAAGRVPDLAAHAETVGRRLLALVGIAIVSGILTGVAALFLVIPGIYVGLRLSLAPAACVIDDMGIGDSLSESWEVAQGNLLKLFGIQLATGLVSLIVLAALVGVTGSWEPLVQGDPTALFVPTVLSTPVTAVVAPLAQLAIARVYLENRGRDDADGDGTMATDDSENLTVQPDDDDWQRTTEEFDDGPAEVDDGTDERDEDKDDYWDDR
jgi:hypothetical protein